MNWAGWVFYISIAIIIIGIGIHLIGIILPEKNLSVNTRKIINWIGGVVITIAVLGLIIAGFGLLYGKKI
jgi:hypothetical protein